VRLASPHTVAAYRRDLDNFLEYCGAQSEPGSISRAQVQEWLVQSHSAGLAATTLARRLSALSSFFDACVQAGRCANNPAAGVRPPRQPKRLPRTLPPEQTEALMHQTDRASETRDLALVVVMYGCGLRVSEVVGLNLNDIDLPQCELRVLGKGRKERVVPLPAGAMDCLSAWLGERSPSADEVAVFLNRFGKRLSTRSVQRMLKARALENGADISVTPHRLRHSFATHLWPVAWICVRFRSC